MIKYLTRMKTFIPAIILSFLFPGLLSAQSIQNVDFNRDGQNILISYSLSGDNNSTYFIEVYCSEDGGKTYGPALKAVTGDVGPGIRPGKNKTIRWDVLSDKDELTGQIIFDVVATEEKRIRTYDPYSLGIPDLFTPGGNNNLFKPDPLKWSGISSHEITIYNKSGEKVWESMDFPNGWNGKQDYKYVPPGTYFWILEITTGTQNNKQIIKGELVVFSPEKSSIPEPVVKPASTNEFTDTRDGNTYKTVRIGNQTWMAENLNYKTNGTSWCYENKVTNCDTYGALYDYESAKTVCPDGWHLPSEDEWDVLFDFVGGKKVAGGKLKEAGFDHWSSPNERATNDFGFTALPGGQKSQMGAFTKQTKTAYFWTAHPFHGKGAWFIELRNNEEGINFTLSPGRSSLSVRCIKN